MDFIDPSWSGTWKELAEKHDIPLSTLTQRAKKDDWQYERDLLLTGPERRQLKNQHILNKFYDKQEAQVDSMEDMPPQDVRDKIATTANAIKSHEYIDKQLRPVLSHKQVRGIVERFDNIVGNMVGQKIDTEEGHMVVTEARYADFNALLMEARQQFLHRLSENSDDEPDQQ